MSESEDLDALLGAGFTEELLDEAREEKVINTDIIKQEEVTMDNMPEAIISDTADVVRKSNEAITSVLQDLQAAPADPAVLAGASNLLNAHAQLLAQFNKTNALYARMAHEKEMLRMKLSSDKAINDDNNKTKVMLTREEMFNELKQEMSKN